MHENKVQSPGHEYKTLCDPSNANHLIFSLISSYWHTLLYLPTHTCLTNSQLVLQDSNQVSPSQKRLAYSTSVFPQYLLKHKPVLLTVLLHHTETLRAGTVSQLSLRPWYFAQSLAHKEVLKSKMNLIFKPVLVWYTHQFGNTNWWQIDSVLIQKTSKLTTSPSPLL